MLTFNVKNLCTKESVISACEQANFETFCVIMNDNSKLYITPDTWYSKITTIDEIKFFNVSGPMPWMDRDTIEELIQSFKTYDDDLKSYNEDRRKLQEYYQKHIRNKIATPEEKGFYSDWHKDIYGYRPR